MVLDFSSLFLMERRPASFDNAATASAPHATPVGLNNKWDTCKPTPIHDIFCRCYCVFCSQPTGLLYVYTQQSAADPGFLEGGGGGGGGGGGV